MGTIYEPFRIKMTEPIRLTTRDERLAALRRAHWNVFLLDADDCIIDLLTDSGTGAMSDRQWAAMMMGDESYAGSRSWKHFESVVHGITGMPHIFPTHQGRAAESLLTLIRVTPGNLIPNNSHFDTTRANIEFAGAEALDLPSDDGSTRQFRGNMDLERLAHVLHSESHRIPFVMITVTNNAVGGQPVSMANIRAVRELTRQYGIPLVMDACRFAENAYFIQQHEPGYEHRPLSEIASDMFASCDAATMSLKKDGLVNIGGFFVCRQADWATDFRNAMILREGFPTYGGLAGRDLEAAAVGLREALEPSYQAYRHATVAYVQDRLLAACVPVVEPAGGHAVFIDAARFLPHLRPEAYPGIALVNALYLAGGIRSVELGSLMFGKSDGDGVLIPARRELVRLAFPRRVYTQSHFDYLVEVIVEVWQQRTALHGFQIVSEPPFLRHFSAHLTPV